MTDQVPVINQMSVILEWHHALRREETCHLRCVAQSHEAQRRFGFWSAILSAVVGTSIFLSLQQQELPVWARVLVGMISITAAVLSAIQVYAKGSDKLEEHQAAATQYNYLRREIEGHIPAPPSSLEWPKFEATFRKSWRVVNEKAPPYSQNILDAAEKHMRRRVPFVFPYSMHAA